MNKRSIIAFLAGFTGIILFAIWSSSAHATKKQPAPVSQSSAKAVSHNEIATQSASKAVSSAEGGKARVTNDVAVAGSTATQGIDSSYNVEASAPDVILVPNNNTESCLRVWGLSFSNQQGGGGLGVPTRSASCDFEQAADDAAAVGDQRMAWFWRCHKKNIYKPFIDRSLPGRERKGDAIDACQTKMNGFVDASELQRSNEELRGRIEFLLRERDHEREVCDERIERCEARAFGEK